MNPKIIWIMIVLSILVPAVSADANYTKIVPATDQIIVNQTSIYSEAWTTPLVFFTITIIIGGILLLLTLLAPPKHPYDILSWIAPIPLFFSCIMSWFGIDVRTSAGLAGMVVDGVNRITVIENHTIYKPWLLLIFFIGMFILSLVNISRVQKAKTEELIKAPED